MVINKKRIWKFFILIETILFFSYITFSVRGIKSIWNLQQQNVIIKNKYSERLQEIKDLQKEIDDWEAYPFFREKYAREQLQMAGQHEEIYFIE